MKNKETVSVNDFVHRQSKDSGKSYIIDLSFKEIAQHAQYQLESGIKDGTIESINKVLQTRELIKIQFREFKDEKLSLSEKIAKITNSEIVGIIGHTLILFRQNPDSEKQEIHFPAKK